MDKTTGLELRGSAGPVAPLQRLALWLASLSGWRRHLMACFLGALAVLSLPPFNLLPVNFLPVLLVSFPGLVWLTDGNTGYRSAFALGWSFGFGFFVAGLYWIAAALFVDIAQFWWLVPFAVAGVPAGLAIFTGVALLVCHALVPRLAPRRHRPRLGARFLLVRRRMAARPYPHRLSLESGRLCLGRNIPGRAAAAAIRLAHRDLRAQPADRARRVPAGAARRFLRPALARAARARCC